MIKNRILFIGNSYTQYNNLPGLVQALCNAAGKPLEAAMETCGGKTLEWHCQNPQTIARIDEGGWDFIILQEQSLRPVQNPDKLCSAAVELATRIRAVGAEPVLYLTWARQHVPEMQEGLTDAYLRAAKEIGASVAPVGPAWKRTLASRPDLVLHDEDQSHPNLAGSYLAACVFYATLSGETPVGLPNEIEPSEGAVASIERADAKLLQKMAWATVQEFTHMEA